MASKTIIVMSDSHGDRAVVEDIKAKYINQVDAIFHNGDSELLACDPLWQGIFVVAGNCDYDSDYPATQTISLGQDRIIQTHGHLQHINFTWDRLGYLAQEAQATLCLYGHLHRPAAWQSQGTVFINPGSVAQPRGEVSEKLYAYITLTDEKIAVDFYTLNHTLYPQLSKEFRR
ncbi:metallophosphoesterase [Streptococcus halichoeri]|uniref:metallophosphoesterase n=1 Tax=Streptococcus halichoeri TaxID=254785 RepID=UPI00135B3D98|nr:metallophosphoesterase [Streptococcus halichoeri]